MTTTMTTIARLATLVLLLTASAGAARAGGENDEHRALKYFATGDYRQALDIYAKLYADTLHPTYLRNIARCYQNLGEADKAIGSFREYLRKAKNLSADERAEVQAYIAELEQKKSAQASPPPISPAPPPTPAPAAAAPPAPAAPPPAAPPPAPAPAALEPAPLVGPPTVTATASPSRDGDTAPVYTRWWFWAAAGGVAVAAIATIVLLSGDRSPLPGNLGAIDLTDKSP